MKVVKNLLVALMVITGLNASDRAFKTDVRVWQSDNSDGKITPKTVEEAFKKAGFVIAANNDMNFPFKRDFKKTHMDVYNLMVVFRKDTALALAEKYPDIGLFTPLSMSIYTPKGEKTISVATLRPEVMAQMMHIPADNPEMIKLGKKIEEALQAAMPKGKFIELPYTSKKSDKEVITRISMEQQGDDWEDAKDDFETAFEEKLAPNGFVMAGFTDLNYDFDEHDKEWYLFYDVYSICKIAVIYEVSKLHPEAGAFAPCSAYKYQKKGEKTIYMAFPNVYKWISSLNITDKTSLDVLIDAQKRFEKMLEELKEGK
jgi:uncharacterized protein (DUF302 family)